jgi:hypothetical protein
VRKKEKIHDKMELMLKGGIVKSIGIPKTQ